MDRIRRLVKEFGGYTYFVAGCGDGFFNDQAAAARCAERIRLLHYVVEVYGTMIVVVF